MFLLIQILHVAVCISVADIDVHHNTTALSIYDSAIGPCISNIHPSNTSFVSS